MPENRVRARRRLADQVIERLQQQISLGALRPGDRLPTETELTAAFGVSRTTIREAVAALAHAGLLTVRQGDGTYIAHTPVGHEALDLRLKRAAALEVYEVRRPLEIEAARLAATRRTAGDVRRMRGLLAERGRLRAAGEASAAVAVDIDFHIAVAEAAKNAVLADVYRAFSAALNETLIHVAHDAAVSVDTTALHEQLVDAIERSDREAAVSVADRLLAADASALKRAQSGRPPRRKRARE